MRAGHVLDAADDDPPGLAGRVRVDGLDDRAEPEPIRDLGHVGTLPAALGVGQLARHVAPRVAVGDVAPPVVELLAARQPQLDLGPAALAVMYSRSGTIVWPLALVRPSSSSISERWSRSLRVRLGSWL